MEEIKCEQIRQIVGSGFTEMTGRVYSTDGLTPSIRTFGGGNTEVKIAEPIIYDDYNGRVRADQDCIGTLTTNCGTDALRNGVKIIEPRICAMRGRNPDNPSDRTTGSPTEQRLEIGSEETSNTLTTVQKDNLVVEPNYRFFEQAFETLQENDCEEGDTIDAYNKRVNKDGVSPTITTRPDGFKTAILPVVKDEYDSLWDIYELSKIYRIRKLTERECFRLMGVKGEDFEKVAKNQSTSSLYHLAGDGIVTTCLMAIFGQLFEIDYQTKINELVGELKQ